MRRAALALVLCLGLAGAGSAFAASTTAVGPSIITANDRWSYWFGSAPAAQTRDWQPNAPDGVKVVDTVKSTLPSGKQVPINASRGVSNAAIKAGLKTIVKGLIPGLTVAEALWDMMEPKGVEKAPDGSAVIDPGAQMIELGGKMTAYDTGLPEAPGSIGARVIATACANAVPYSCAVEVNTSSCSGGFCEWQVTVRVSDSNGNLAYRTGGQDRRTEIRELQCQETTSTLPVLGAGGPCKSPSRVAVPNDVLDGLVTELPPNELPGWAKEIAKGIPNGLPTSNDVPELSGPPYVDDQPQTITRPDGSIETKTKRWDLEYPPDGTVRYTPKLIELDAGGGETVTEGEVPEGDTRTDCDKYPDSIGCSEYGTPGSDQVPRTSQGVTFTPVELAGGSCPAAVTFTAFGQTRSLEFVPICDAVVDYVKPVVLILGAALSVFVFIGGLKS